VEPFTVWNGLGNISHEQNNTWSREFSPRCSCGGWLQNEGVIF